MKTTTLSLSFLFLVLFLVPVSYGQSERPKWQVATIVEAKELPATPEPGSGLVQFEVTLRVGKTDYVALYTQTKASKGVAPYRPGQDLMVLVGSKTVKYNDMLGRTHELPILRQQKVVPVATPVKLPEKG